MTRNTRPRLAFGASLAVWMLGAAGNAWSGMNPGVKLSLDIQTQTAKRQCAPAYESCTDIHSSHAATGYYDILVVLHDYDNVRGVEYSLSWPGEPGFYASGFVGCSDMMVGGTGGSPMDVRQTWESPLIAENDSSGVAIGWLRLWSDTADEVVLGPHGLSGAVAVIDSLFEYDLADTTFVGVVGQTSGADDPCECQ